MYSIEHDRGDTCVAQRPDSEAHGQLQISGDQSEVSAPEVLLLAPSLDVDWRGGPNAILSRRSGLTLARPAQETDPVRDGALPVALVTIGLPDVLPPEVVLHHPPPRRGGVHHVAVALDGVVVVEGEVRMQRVGERQDGHRGQQKRQLSLCIE